MEYGERLKKLTIAALLLSLAIILPFLTGQVPQIGNALCPMHIPVLLCGFICGYRYACIAGFIAPLLRFCLFGVPTLIPKGISMCFELAVYGLVAGLLYELLPKRRICIYISLFCAMVAGRLVWGCARIVLYGLGQSEFGVTFFLTETILESVPGIVVQILLIPIIVQRYYKK